MDFPRLSLDAYIALCLVIATPWLYQTFSFFSAKARSTVLLAHTLVLLHVLLVSPPQNIFKALGVPLNIPPEYLRAKLIETFAGEEKVPLYLGALAKRLGLLEQRSLYVRFGHKVLTSCAYCQSADDFALYAFPGPLLQYICEIAFVGILTLPHLPSAHFRPLGLGALLAALMTEAYWTLTAQVVIPPFGNDTPVTMWHDTFVQLRHLLFLLLPLILSILPSLGLHRLPIIGAFLPSPPVSSVDGALPPAQFQLQGQNQQSLLPPNASLTQTATMTLQTLGHLVPTLHLLKYTHAAVMRSQEDGAEDDSDPSFHARASQWWAEEAAEGRVVRTDDGVRHILKSAGLGLEEAVSDSEDAVGHAEGPLLLSAKMAVKMLKEQGAKPSQHWVFAG